MSLDFLPILIYLMHTLGKLEVLVGISSFVSGLFLVVLFLFSGFAYSDFAITGRKDDKKVYEGLMRWTKRFAVAFSIFVFLAVITPSQRTTYKMLAAYGVVLAVKNERIKNIADNSLAIVEQELQKYLDKNKRD